MNLYGSNVEYGLHCLLYLVDPPAGASISSKDLAEFQSVSPSLVAKLFTQLQKAGIVESAEGIRGGYRLAKPAGATLGLSLEFSLIVGPNGSDEVLIVTDVGGFAEAIPAPGAVLFLLGGAILISARQRVLRRA